MDQQRKSLQVLTVSLDAKREELAGFFRQFGEKLLQESVTAPDAASPVGSERVGTWQTFLSSRESDTAAVLAIQDALVRERELDTFRRELVKDTADARDACNALYEETGRTFYGQYTDDDDRVFAEFHKKATQEGNLLIELEDQHEDMRMKLERSGFLGKIVGQFRIAGVSSKIREQKRRIASIVTEGGRSLLATGSLEQRMTAGLLDQDFTGLLENARSTEGRLKQLEDRTESLESDFSAVKENLRSYGAGDFSSRRLEELHSRISDTDKRISAHTLLCAREYADKFLDDDGKSRLGNTGDGHTFSDMGAYSHQLEQTAFLRSEISVIRRKIELVETSLKIESLDKTISSYEKTIAEHERKIGRLKELIGQLRTSVHSATEERTVLAEHRDSIENSLRE
jgi:archaellum component FlaC